MIKGHYTILLLFFIGVSLLFSGCKGEGGATSTKQDPFLGGTTGLSVDFAEGAPPTEAFDGGDSPFDVVVIVENKGEHTVEKSDCRIKIKGVLASDFSKSEAELIKNPSEDVESTKKNSEGDIIPGPAIYTEFTGFNHDDMLTGNTPFTILAEVCYLYETDSQAMLCIKEDNLDSTTEGRVCKVTETKTVYNSGAPVHIENFKEIPSAKDKVRFTFDVVHKGTGDIYKKSTTCSKDTRADENKVWVEVQSTIAGSISCSNLADGSDTNGYVRLYSQGKNTVSCTQQVTTNSDYETPINIKLQYDYEQTKTTEILIKHLPED